MAVPRQKAFEPKHIAVFCTADNHGAAGPRFQQADPAQDEGAHDALADFGLGDEHCLKALRRDDQGLYGFERMGIDERGPASQLRQFAHEGTWPVGDDWRARTRLIALRDVDITGKDDDEAVANLSNPRQSIAASEGTDVSETAKPFDFRGLQCGKHLVPSRVDDRGCGRGHLELTALGSARRHGHVASRITQRTSPGEHQSYHHGGDQSSGLGQQPLDLRQAPCNTAREPRHRCRR